MANNIRRYCSAAVGEILFDDLRLKPVSRFIIGYSGGRDSQVLLHSMAALVGDEIEIIAAHFNHGLHQDADKWESQCQTGAADCNAGFVSGRAEQSAYRRANIEAEARRQRYQWFDSLCRAGDIVLTAHHLDDQAETFLMQLFKGRGLSQLRGIVAKRPVVTGSPTLVARPLLSFAREQLAEYAAEHRLSWIEDPANFNIDFDRSLLRRELLPLLKSRNPHIVDDLCRGANACAMIHCNTMTHFRRRKRAITAPQARGPLCRAQPLDASKIIGYGLWYFNEAIRFWLHDVGVHSPSNNQLQQLYGQVSDAAVPSAAINWKQWQICCFHKRLYLLRKPVAAAGKKLMPMPWNGARLKISADTGIAMQSTAGQVESVEDFGELDDLNMTLCWRSGGERVKLPGKRHSESLKKLFQAKQIPPWERDQLPYLRVRDEIAWVHGIGKTVWFPQSMQKKRLTPFFYAL